MSKQIFKGMHLKDSPDNNIITEGHTAEECLNYLVESLLKGITVFFYKKSDGSIRKAIGTKNAEFMPEIPKKDPNKPGKKPNPNIITYYDLEAKGPRAMRKENLISIF